MKLITSLTLQKPKTDPHHIHSCNGHIFTSTTNQKKKKNVTAVLYNLTLTMRRRHHLHHHNRSIFPVVSAFSGCLLLLLFAAFALLSSHPPPHSHSHLDHHLHHHGLHLPHRTLVSTDASDSEIQFRIPEGKGSSLNSELWRSRSSKYHYGCSNASASFRGADLKTEPNRYLLIATSGGLNQQRTGITDAVVAAYILNATLVVPKLDENSFWKDSSGFADIFDVDWFLSFLSNDVKIIKELPTNDGKVLNPTRTRVPRKCTPKCYENRVLPLLKKKHAVQLGKFDYRLSNRLDMDLQKLRCRVNYHGLRFTQPILDMGKRLVAKMKAKSNHFIALHLRFEPDMLAFSGCDYGGGEKERAELGAIRKRWKTLHASNPEKERRHGRCPLTPEEVGLMLRALGFGSDVHLYVASGEVYGGEETLTPLKELFPNFYTKETLATEEELEPFYSFSSRMAALDFIVCDESDAFVTNNNGNMAKILAGRRRYFGHKQTIRPNAKKLYKLFMNRNNMTWDEFESQVQTSQIGFMGAPKEIKPGRGEFHENPSGCICQDPDAMSKGDGPKSLNDSRNSKKDESSSINDDRPMEDERDQDVTDTDYVEGGTAAQGKGMNSGILLKTEQTEPEEIFSD